MPDRERKRVPDDRSDILKGILPKRWDLGHGNYYYYLIQHTATVAGTGLGLT